jgi:hypothetical protein
MENEIMRAILAEPGREPEILKLPADGLQHEEAIRDALGGNYGAVEFFPIRQGISLFVLVNDLAAVLGLPANRRFPGQDSEYIIFGKAIFIAAYNGELAETEGTIDMPEEMCQMFIEQIQRNFACCDGTEKPRAQDTLYFENQGETDEKTYRWLEIAKPTGLGPAIEAGRVKFYNLQNEEIMEADGRFFRKLVVYTPDTTLD